MIRQYELVERVRGYDPDASETALNRAYVFSMSRHGSQKRASGDPYFSHPVEVAGILTDLKLDGASIITALLHDTVEDGVASEGEIEKIKALLARPGRVTASHNPGTARNAIDGNLSTRWDTATPMRGGEWFKIELDADQVITGIVLDTSGSGADYPRGYEIYVSKGSVGAGQLVAKGNATNPVTKIKFDKPAKGGVLKIVQTGRAEGNFWSIHELTIIAK